jgi:hypothetical protein
MLQSYDAHRRITSSSYTVNGSVIQSITFSYDAFGRLSEVDTTGPETIADRWSYSGLDASEQISVSGVPGMTSHYVEDQSGRKLSGTFMSIDGKSGTWSFTYDSAGRMTSEEQDYSDGTMLQAVVLTYNTGGQLLSFTQRVGNSSTMTQMTYGPDGRQATMTTTIGASTPDVYTSHYCP